MRRPTFVGDFAIPRVVPLPGCRVRVKVVPPEEAEKIGACDGVWLYDYAKQTAVVLIDGRNPIEVQRYTLLHEIVHAAHEVIDLLLEKQPEHVATKSMVAMRKEQERLRDACAMQDGEVCQTLGKALGYPWYKDDQKNFPGATEEHGVCVGEHVAESIAAEAAKRIEALRQN